VIIAEVGLSMAVFPTCGHPVSWVKLSPRTIQSGAATRTGRTGKGNHYLKTVLSEPAAVADRGNSFLGARYRRPAKRVGRLGALVAVSRSILHFPRPAERGLAFLSIARTHGHKDVDRSTRPQRVVAERVLPELHRAVEDLGDVVLGDLTG
jgi:Transposase IS116/IS110/IS902 family